MASKSYKREAASAVMGVNLVLLIMWAMGHDEAAEPARLLMPYAAALFGAAFGFHSVITQMRKPE